MRSRSEVRSRVEAVLSNWGFGMTAGQDALRREILTEEITHLCVTARHSAIREVDEMIRHLQLDRPLASGAELALVERATELAREGILTMLSDYVGVGEEFQRGVRFQIREGWEDAGRQGRAIGIVDAGGQNWAVVVWDGEEDPATFKLAALERVA